MLFDAMVNRTARAALFFLSIQVLVGAAPQSSAVIEGVVFGSNKPLAGAEVLLIQSAVPTGTTIVSGTSTSTVITSVKTDSSGQYLIRDVPPGSYQLFAAHDGFVRQEYGQKSAFHSGTLLLIAAGQILRNIDFKLTTTGAVTGRVTDENGQPLQGISVELLRPAYDSDGRRMLRLVDSRPTNDLGEYRLYWITPGRYFIAANASRSSLEMSLRSPSSGIVAGTAGAQIQIEALRNRNEVVDQSYTKAYYLNTTDSSRAISIEVQSGMELPGIDFQLPRLPRFRVRGHLVDAVTGTATGRSGSVSLNPLEPGAAGLPSTSFDRSSGAFEVKDVPSGAYALDAAMLAANPSTTQSSFARLRVDVTGDVDDLVIPIRSGTQVSGRIDVEGLGAIGDLPGFGAIGLRLISTLLPDSLSSQSKQIAANGTFTIENVTSGEYRVRFSGLPPGTYVKSALIGTRDIIQDSITVGITSPPSMSVLISRNASELSGVVVDKNQNPIAGTSVVLIPDQQREQHDLYKTVLTNAAGRFTIQGIVPGEYRLFSWEDLEPYSYFDAAVLQQFEALGRPIHATESSKQAVILTIIAAN